MRPRAGHLSHTPVSPGTSRIPPARRQPLADLHIAHVHLRALEHEPARYQQALVGPIISLVMFVFGLTVPVILLAVLDMREQITIAVVNPAMRLFRATTICTAVLLVATRIFRIRAVVSCAGTNVVPFMPKIVANSIIALART
jgi:hypothetical protein